MTLSRPVGSHEPILAWTAGKSTPGPGEPADELLTGKGLLAVVECASAGCPGGRGWLDGIPHLGWFA